MEEEEEELEVEELLVEEEVELWEDMIEIGTETETDITRKIPEIWKDGHVKITLTGTIVVRRICGIHEVNLHQEDQNQHWQRLHFHQGF